MMSHLAQQVDRRQLRPREMRVLFSLLPPLLEVVRGQLHMYDDRCISNTLHAMAVLELGTERELVGQLLAAAEMQLQRFGPQVRWWTAVLKHQPRCGWQQARLQQRCPAGHACRNALACLYTVLSRGPVHAPIVMPGWHFFAPSQPSACTCRRWPTRAGL